MNTSKKLSISDLKEKAGKAYLDAQAIKGGTLDNCHVDPDDEVGGPVIQKTDNA